MAWTKIKNSLRGLIPGRDEEMRETVTDWYLAVMLLVHCLWLPKGYTSVEGSKFEFFAVATLVWLVMLAGLSLIEGPPRGFFTPARVAALVFAGVCLLSAAVSPFGFRETVIGHRYTGLVTQLLLVVVLLGVSRFGRCKERHFVAFGIGITVLGVICILQKQGMNVFDFYPGGRNYFYYTTFLGTIGHIDTLASVIGLAVPLFLGLFVKSEAFCRWLYFIPLFLSSMTLTMGGAESGMLSVAVVSVVAPAFLIRSMKELRRTLGGAAFMLAGVSLGRAMGFSRVDGVRVFQFQFETLTIACLVFSAVLIAASWLLRFVRREPSGRMFRNAFIVVAVVGVMGALTAVWFWPGESGTLYEVSQILHGHFEDSYGNDRIGVWRVTLTNVPEAPLLGGGPGTLHLRTVKVLDDGLVARLAHNVYLQFLVDTGILGLLSYLAVIVTALVVRRRDRWKPVHIALILAALSYAIQDFFNLGVPSSSPFFWIVLGLLQTETHENQAPPRKKK